MITRNLIALGAMLAVMSLAGTGFAADQKAAGTTAPAATNAAPAPDAGTPAKPAKKKKKHSSSSTSSGTSTAPAPAPKN